MKSTLTENRLPLGKSVASNFDHQWRDDVAERLKTGNYYASYPGWYFHSRVWWDGQEWVGEVWQYHEVVGWERAATGPELIKAISEKYGHE